MPNQQITAPTATYVISYDVSGAMRSFQRLRRALLGRHRPRLERDDPCGADNGPRAWWCARATHCTYGPAGRSTTCPATASLAGSPVQPDNLPPDKA